MDVQEKYKQKNPERHNIHHWQENLVVSNEYVFLIDLYRAVSLDMSDDILLFVIPTIRWLCT